MNYKLHFIKKSKKEWDKLNFYKIKLRSSDFRLAYEVREDKIIIVILAVGKRENNDVYDSLKSRIDYEDEEP